MKNFKKNNGITLVALIITIIILLILAAVTIMSITGDGIISKSRQAKDDYERSKQEEEGLLSGYLSKMDEVTGDNAISGSTTWTDNGDGTFTSSYGITVALGDKVAYDEGSGKTSSVDSTFEMKDMQWRILNIEDDGKIKLISTQPTDSRFKFSEEISWINSEEKLDMLCNDLYANGNGVIARSLKVEDINKLANYDPTTYSDYGSLWRYKYNPDTNRIQYSKSTDNGNTWTTYENTDDKSFSYPGEEAIDSTNYQDSNGNLIVKELKRTTYFYSMEDKITQKTADGISVWSLIIQRIK